MEFVLVIEGELRNATRLVLRTEGKTNCSSKQIQSMLEVSQAHKGFFCSERASFTVDEYVFSCKKCKKCFKIRH